MDSVGTPRLSLRGTKCRGNLGGVLGDCFASLAKTVGVMARLLCGVYPEPEILRCAQNDRGRTQNDRGRRARNDTKICESSVVPLRLAF